MKRLGIAVLGALSVLLVTAGPAVAQGSTVDDGVLPRVIVQAPGGLAFAGSEVTVWMVLAAALLLLGVAFLIAARRRSKTASD